MIAEENGLVRLLFWQKTPPSTFITLGSEVVPLSSVHWSPMDRMRFGAVAERRWLVWNLGRRGVQVTVPERSEEVYPEGGRLFQWSTLSRDLFATSSLRKALKVHDVRGQDIVHPYPQRNTVVDFSWQKGGRWIVVTADCFLKFICL